jgi:hypothetical protein
VPETTVIVRLTARPHHIGALWVRFQQAGCQVAEGPQAVTLCITGDPDHIARVVERWDGEGEVHIVR